MNPIVFSPGSQDLTDHPLHNFQQDRPLKKGDRVTFFNEITNCWTIATILTGPNKYYKKHGPNHNFIDVSGAKGGHYFHPGGFWSILTDDQNQLSVQPQQNTEVDSDSENESLMFIDDDYSDHLELSLSPQLPHDGLFLYPSAASFPDDDTNIPYDPPFRERYLSQSESDIPSQGCHQSLHSRWRRLKSAVRAWSIADIHHTSCEPEEETRGKERGEEDRGEATPP